MCQFLSALVLRNGDVLCDPEHGDSHEDLLQAAGLRDDRRVGDAAFVRVELVPDREEIIWDVSTWRFVLDEHEAPDWWPEHASRVEARLRAMVSAVIVTDERPLLEGGYWILAGQAKVREVRDARIVGMYGSSSIEYVLDPSRVEEMYDSSRIENMLGSSWLGHMYDLSRVENMFGLSTIWCMCDSSRVGYMHDSASVRYMYHSSEVGVMSGSSRIEEMSSSSNVGYMYHESSVGHLWDSASIEHMCDSARAGYVHGSATTPGF